MLNLYPRSRKRKHIDFIYEAVYDLKYSLLNDALKLDNLTGLNLDNKVKIIKQKSKRMKKYQRYLKQIEF